MPRARWQQDGEWYPDVLLSEAEMAALAPARRIDPVGQPVPTRMSSNGEFFPLGQTRAQQQVEARVRELSATSAKKLGISRRGFLRSAAGMAAGFLAMNEVYGPYFKVHAAELMEPAARAGMGLPADLFVFDDQVHMVRSGVDFPVPLLLRAGAQGPTSGWPSNPGNPNNELNELGETWTNLNPRAHRPARARRELPAHPVRQGRVPRQPGAHRAAQQHHRRSAARARRAHPAAQHRGGDLGRAAHRGPDCRRAQLAERGGRLATPARPRHDVRRQAQPVLDPVPDRQLHARRLEGLQHRLRRQGRL